MSSDIILEGYPEKNAFYIIPTYLFLVPTSPPLNVTGFLDDTEKLIVTWNPLPLDHRLGIILGYHIMYEAQNSGYTQEMNVSSFNLSATLQNVQWGRLYEIKVAAFNSVGKGPPSPLIVLRSPDGSKRNLI